MYFYPFYSYNLHQGWFQDFFQGVAEISSGGGENLPGGGEKKLASFPSAFFYFPTHYITNLRPLFYILDLFYKEIHKIYIFLSFFLFVFYVLYASLVPLNVLGSGGSKPLKMVRGWRDGPRHPHENASDLHVFNWLMGSIHPSNRPLSYNIPLSLQFPRWSNRSPPRPGSPLQ